MIMYKAGFVVIVFWGVLALPVAADVLTVDGREQAGVFCGYDKKRLSFQEWRKDTPGQHDIARVERLRLDRPVRVSFAYARNTRQKQAGVLHGFKDGDFDLETGGRRFPVPDWKLARLEVAFDMRDFMLRREAALNPEPGQGGQNTHFEVSTALPAGQAFVVHFHQPGSAASERQGNYARRLCEESRGQAVYHQVKVEPKPDDPNIRRYDLKSLPQFWFYTPEGVLSRRLAERFTESDLENALASARRGR